MKDLSEQGKCDLVLSQFLKGLGMGAIMTKSKGVVGQLTVFRTAKSFKEEGKTKRAPSTRKVTLRTPPMVKMIWEKVQQDLRWSMRALAEVEGVSASTMRRLCRDNLGLTPYKKQHWQVLSKATKAKQLKQGCSLLKIL